MTNGSLQGFTFSLRELYSKFLPFDESLEGSASKSRIQLQGERAIPVIPGTYVVTIKPYFNSVASNKVV
jgi:hypothetical protein